MSKIDPKLLDVVLPEHDGYPDELAAQDTRDVLMSAASAGGVTIVDFPKHMYVPRKDWAEVARMAEKNRTRALDFLDRFTNQNPSHECTTHAGQAVFTSARNRARRMAIGPPVAHKIKEESRKSASVYISPLSVYAEANPRRWGGAMVREILEISGRRGWLPDRIQPRDWSFKHTLQGTSGEGNECQSGGGWVSLSQFPDGWEETAKHFRPLEVIFPKDLEELVCCILGGPEGMGLGVAVGRKGHSIPYMFLDPDDMVIGYADSYNVIRYDSLSLASSAVGGSYCIVSTTVPDDWSRPAGL